MLITIFANIYTYIYIRTHIRIRTNTHNKHRQHPSNAAINADHPLRDSQRVKRPPPLHPRLARPPPPSLNCTPLCRLHAYHLSITSIHLRPVFVCLHLRGVYLSAVSQSVQSVCLSVCLSICLSVCLSVLSVGFVRAFRKDLFDWIRKEFKMH